MNYPAGFFVANQGTLSVVGNDRLNGAWSTSSGATATFANNQIVINPLFAGANCTANDMVTLVVFNLTLSRSPAPVGNVTVQTITDPLPSNALQTSSLVLPQVSLLSFSSSSLLYVGQTGVALSFQFTTSAVGTLSGGGGVTLSCPLGFFAGTGSLSAVVNGIPAVAVAYSGSSQINIALSSTTAVGANAVVHISVLNVAMGSTPTAGGNITVQTSADTVASNPVASGPIGGQILNLAITSSKYFVRQVGAGLPFLFQTTAGGAMAVGVTSRFYLRRVFFPAHALPPLLCLLRVLQPQTQVQFTILMLLHW